MTPAPVRLLIHGASGRMGRALCRLSSVDSRFLVVGAVSRHAESADDAIPRLRADDPINWPLFDVAVDFSLPSGFDSLLAACVARGSGLVSGTTGLDEAQHGAIATASGHIPIVWASNFSVGIVVLTELVRQAVAALPGWSAEIREVHHLQKLDAPSGTALGLAGVIEAAGGGRPEIESSRQGSVVGDHTVRLTGPDECVEFTHKAADRDIFARGALEAAMRLHRRKPGNFCLATLLMAG